MKGHTHEDCDQLFSRFGVKLGKNDVVTVDGKFFFVWLKASVYILNIWFCSGLCIRFFHKWNLPYVFLILTFKEEFPYIKKYNAICILPCLHLGPGNKSHCFKLKKKRIAKIERQTWPFWCNLFPGPKMKHA